MNENLFTGKWYVSARYELLSSRRCLLLTREETGSLVWEFCGKFVLEWCGKHPMNWAQYIYDPIENQLIIDRSDIEPDGFVWICYEERYRVESLDDNSLMLYDLQEI